MPGPAVASLVAGSGNAGPVQNPAPAPSVPASSSSVRPAETPKSTPKESTPKPASKPASSSAAPTPTPKSTGKKCRQRKREAAPEPEAAPSPEKLYADAVARAEANATRRELGASFVRRHSNFDPFDLLFLRWLTYLSPSTPSAHI
ncbi:hypothetical protein ONZ45_g18724 [Pleurotus djamor]|nr:hypothetical protein ONZ45_g18724 [Pleurotus djamor]